MLVRLIFLDSNVSSSVTDGATANSWMNQHVQNIDIVLIERQPRNIIHFLANRVGDRTEP
jgi:hypothetical protein